MAKTATLGSRNDVYGIYSAHVRTRKAAGESIPVAAAFRSAKFSGSHVDGVYIPPYFPSLRGGSLLAALALVADQHGIRHHAGLGAHLVLDGRGDLRVVPQEGLGVLAALADPLALGAEPGARLLDDGRLHA